MQDMSKTKAQLVEELGQLRKKIARLEQVEEALKESEKKFRALTESTTAQIMIAHEDRFFYANKAALDHYGLTWEELSARKPDEVLIKDEAQRAEAEAFEKELVRRGDTTVHHEFSEPDEDGGRRWFEAHASQLEVDGEPAWIWTKFDITERKRAHQAIEQSERKFRSLAETTSAHISIIQEDRHVYANQAFLDYFELDAEELQLISPEDLAMGVMAPETMKQAMHAWQASHDRGDAHFRFEFQDLEGRWFQTNVTMMELDGKPSYMAMNIDITEHKRAQEALTESEKKFRALAESTTAQIVISQEDRFIYANKAFLDHYSLTWEELTARTPQEVFIQDEAEAAECEAFAQEQLRLGGGKFRRVYNETDKDGNERWFEAHVTQLEIDGVPSFISTSFDITELRRAQNEMYRADKMAALGQIVAGVAHEINNPNNFIYFNLPILRKYIEAIAPLLELRLEEEPDLKILNMPYEVFIKDVFKLLENMEHGSERITSIVSDLRSYVRSDEDQDRKAEQVGQAVQRVMTLVGKQVRKMVKRFDVEIADGLPPVQMNMGKIEQVLINLLINAGDAADKEESWVKVSARPAAGVEGWVELLVEDNGAGIPEDNLEQIFEPFFTSKGRDQGTGLGLSISHRIIEEHGGRINVKSKLGEGTCFTILLPAADDA